MRRLITACAITSLAALVGACGGGASKTLAPPTTLAASSTSTTTPPPPATTSIALNPFAGTWGAHEMSLVIDSAGSGRLTYPDLALCPSCSMASAPEGTLTFVLRSVTGGVAMGTVTASSETKDFGQPVTASLTAGSPGELLQITIGGQELVDFCNSTSAGQCGA
jgi:hypothetical protein